MDIFQYKKGDKVKFKSVKDQQCFYSRNGVLYKKILSQDLKIYGITSINAISIINGGLTKFDDDEIVIKAITKYKHNND